MRFGLGGCLALFLSLALGAVAFGTETVAPPSDLTVEYAREPLGLDVARPRLAWLTTMARQTAYQVRVAATPDGLKDGGVALWDSGKVVSSGGRQAPYAGPAQVSRTRYWWSVRTWDGQGKASAWSAPSWWETGLLDPSDWRGAWIGGRQTPDHDWSDQTITIDFTLKGQSLDVLFRARPVGKTYGEAYVWRIGDPDGRPTLSQQVRHYPGGSNPAVSQETLAEAALPTPAGALRDRRHRLVIEAKGRVIRTSLDGAPVATLTDDGQASGTIGFFANEARAAVIHGVAVTAGGATVFQTDFAGNANPFSGGDVSDEGLVVAAGVPKKDIVLTIGAPAPLLRRAFSAGAQPVRAARLYVAAGGWPKLSLNGQTVGASALENGYTDYAKRVLYRAYDVTALVRSGENVLAAEVGRGWYGINEPNEWYFHQAPWRAEPTLKAQLEITFADGSRQVVATDGSWKTRDGPTLSDSIYSGERYDARREPKGWRAAGFSDADWSPASVVAGPKGRLVAAMLEPIAPVGEIRPVALTQARPGVWVYDFGRIFAGRLRLEVSGPAGRTVSLVQGEKLADDRTVPPASGLIDSQLQTDRYTLAGDGVERWTPSFSYKGFRYVQVEGFPGTPTLAALTGEAMHSAVADAGAFEVGDALVDKIQQAARNGLLNNMHGFQTDTPTLEKNGWTGDAQASSAAAIRNFDVARVWTKWLADFRDAQAPSGELPEIVPSTPYYGFEDTPGWSYLWGPTPAWDAAAFVLPQEMYEQYGDVRILDEMFETQRKLVDYTLAQTDAPDFTYDRGLGEYAAAGFAGPVDATSSAYIFYMVDRLARNAAVLERKAEAEKYGALAVQVRAAYNRKYWDAAAGLYRAPGEGQPYAQTMNVLPLAFGMAPDGAAQGVADRLAKEIEVNGYHLSTGVFALRYVLGVLSDHGHGDVAYKVVTQTDEPSWGWWIKNGLSTMLEGWSLGSRSWDHHYFGSVSAWFYEGLAGVRATAPGYAAIAIRPVVPAGLDHAGARLRTVRGEVRSAWRREAGDLVLETAIPGDATAEVRVSCGGRKAEAPKGARFLRLEAGDAVYAVGSGDFTFRCGVRR
ncbi:MAG: family 78 glycoside hydrolase catalytic domain [Caulobacteraceae bacterium]|nr:family 78 glycoside hydrolase catalytic domain [Caulobacteraceae bacterium]